MTRDRIFETKYETQKGWLPSCILQYEFTHRSISKYYEIEAMTNIRVIPFVAYNNAK